MKSKKDSFDMRALLIGLIASLGSSLVLAIVFSYIINKEYINVEGISMYADLIHLIAVLVGSCGVSMVGFRKQAAAFLLAGVYFFALITLAFLFCGKLSRGVLTGVVSMFLSALFAWLLQRRLKKRKMPYLSRRGAG